jgi:hypothetical protein
LSCLTRRQKTVKLLRSLTPSKRRNEGYLVDMTVPRLFVFWRLFFVSFLDTSIWYNGWTF